MSEGGEHFQFYKKKEYLQMFKRFLTTINSKINCKNLMEEEGNIYIYMRSAKKRK